MRDDDHLPASAFGAPHRRDRIWLVAYPGGEGSQGRPVPVGDGAQESEPRNGRVGDGWWLTEPAVGRVAHGIPARVDRLRALGNALVPQIAEWIGRQIVEWELTA